MQYTMDERIRRISQECLLSQENDPVKLFCKIADMDFVRIHGPEHHFLDGACLLVAFRNAGGDADLEKGLARLAEESVKMPGAMCGHWGVCGAVTSIGAALGIIDKTGPLSQADWGSHMCYTSKALLNIASTGGPRCCKRDAFFTLLSAVEYINENYGIKLPVGQIKCTFSHKNEQCLKEDCPFCSEK